jgi:hypothetical protein
MAGNLAGDGDSAAGRAVAGGGEAKISRFRMGRGADRRRWTSGGADLEGRGGEAGGGRRRKKTMWTVRRKKKKEDKCVVCACYAAWRGIQEDPA